MNVTNKRIIMLGGLPQIYLKAKELGFDLTVIQAREDLTLDDFKRIDTVVTCPMNDDMVIGIVEAMHNVRPFDVALSFQEFGLMKAAILGDRFQIAANPLYAVERVCNKGLMRRHLEEHGIPSIPYAVVQTPTDVLALTQTCGWPIILKPIAGAGSRQIHKLFNPSEVAGALDSITTEFPGALAIAEKFIEGPEISVEAITWEGCHDVLAITDKITSGAPYFVETGHNMPSALPVAVQEAVQGLTRRFLASIRHWWGPSHTEMIITSEGPIIVESHTRTGGDRLYEMVEYVTGIDMFGATLKGFAGEFPMLHRKALSGAAIRFIVLNEGRITGIAGLDDVRDSPGVVSFELDVAVGTEVRASRNSTERHGYILATGVDSAAAIANVERAREKLIIDLEQK